MKVNSIFMSFNIKKFVFQSIRLKFFNLLQYFNLVLIASKILVHAKLNGALILNNRTLIAVVNLIYYETLKSLHNIKGRIIEGKKDVILKFRFVCNIFFFFRLL